MRKHFQKSGLRIDGTGLFAYLPGMDAELAALEAKVQQAASQLRLLREESRELRQQVAAKTDENVRLAEKLAAARTRIEALLRQIPETEA